MQSRRFIETVRLPRHLAVKREGHHLFLSAGALGVESGRGGSVLGQPAPGSPLSHSQSLFVK